MSSGSASTPFGTIGHAARQTGGLRQDVVGIEARGDDLCRVEGITSPASIFACAISAARAICQPPATMPSSVRKGTAPADAARTSLP
jgi:hypothetical protein